MRGRFLFSLLAKPSLKQVALNTDIPTINPTRRLKGTHLPLQLLSTLHRSSNPPTRKSWLIEVGLEVVLAREVTGAATVGEGVVDEVPAVEPARTRRKNGSLSRN